HLDRGTGRARGPQCPARPLVTDPAFRPSPVAEIPTGPVAVPDLVRRVTCGEPIPVWRNELGGLTFRAGDRFVKFNPPNPEIDLERERERLEWLRGRHPVPEVLDARADASGQVLVARALPGESAVAPTWRARPRAAARAIGAGLRMLHDALPVETCPFEWSAESRGGIDPPPSDRLVVCHGDACSPNTLLAPDGSFAGHVDLGSLGVADRWADLAVASMALDWNFDPGWEGEFWRAYGIEPDAARV